MQPESKRKTRALPYLLHRPSGRAYTYVVDDNGKRRMVYLGTHESPESYREWRRVNAERFQGVTVRAQTTCATAPSDYPTIGELCARFLLWGEKHYRRADGTPTDTLKCWFVAAFKSLLKLYRDTPTDRFNVTDLEAVRDYMVAQLTPARKTEKAGPKGRKPKKPQKALARTTINQRIGKIRELFKWGVGKRIVPAPNWQELCALKPLEPGRTDARESTTKGPVDPELVEKTLPRLPAPVVAMVRLQLATGMRPSEVCAMSLDQVQRRKDGTWVYRPRHDKRPHTG